MKLYIAGSFAKIDGVKVDALVDFKFNRLESFYSIYQAENIWEENLRNISAYNSYLLDSGAYTFITGKSAENIDIDSFTDRYIEFLQESGTDLFFEMDVDSIYGYDKVRELRKRIEQGVGKPVMPVFHLERGKDDFISMCKDYDYIGLGLFGKDFSYTDWKAAKAFVEKAKELGCRVHGLGVTGKKMLSKVRFDSVDSSSCIQIANYGGVCQFRGKGMYIHKDGAQVKSFKHVQLHNLKEWIKLGRYLEDKELWI